MVDVDVDVAIIILPKKTKRLSNFIRVFLKHLMRHSQVEIKLNVPISRYIIWNNESVASNS